jgi:uncharacterized protein (TIGR02271 family)
MAERSQRVPLHQERARVVKRTRTTGAVRVTKRVRERTAVIDASLASDVVDVDRRPMNRFVDAAIPDRYDGDTLVISIVEEITVVEKRLRLKEELRITRRRVETRQPQRVRLRSEEAVVERVDASGRIIHQHSTPAVTPAKRR